ncbi:MAG: hypothetical protein II467_03645 [Bacilli bacterium]|nr:hypothetical protein [Bacilli bacterium]MBQ4254673.1 hypothetical protein [Bacilli bacterium]
MMKKRKKLTKKQLEFREKLLSWINAVFAVGILVAGLVTLSFASSIANEPIDPQLPEANEIAMIILGIIITVVVMILSAVMEINACVVRRQKRVLWESLPLAGAYFALAIVLLFARSALYLVSTIVFTIFFTLTFAKLFYIHLQSKKKSNTFFWYIVAFAIVALGGGFIIAIWVTRDRVFDYWSVIAFYYLLEGIFLIIYTIFKGKSPGKFVKVLRKTHATEILGGLVFMIIVVSIALSFIEPKINSIGDALWYCFASVTTIGFGDFAAETPVGRVLTVILGIYGIVVTALITSIIVNLYNERKSEEDMKHAAEKALAMEKEQESEASADNDEKGKEEAKAEEEKKDADEAKPSKPSEEKEGEITPEKKE